MKFFLYPALLVFCFLINAKIFAQCTVNAGNDTSICLNSAGIITATVTNTSTLKWKSPTAIITAGANTSKVTINTTTPGAYTLIINGNNGACTDTVIVTIKPLPVFTFTANNECSNTPVKFVATEQPGITYSWDFGDKITANGSAAIHNFDAPVGNGISSYTVTLTARDIIGCTQTSSQTVIVKQKPDARLSDNTIFPDVAFTNCSGGNYKLKITNTSTTNNACYVINWGDGSPVLNLVSFTDTAHTYTSNGYFTLSYTVNGANNCIGVKTYTIYNGSNPDVPFSNPGGSVNICVPFLYSIPSLPSTNPLGTIYVINKNDGSINDTLTHPPPPTYKHNFTNSSCGALGGKTENTFLISIRAQNPCGQSDVTIEPITTSIKPVADFKISPDTVSCINTLVTFSNTSLAGITVNNFGICDYTTKMNWVISPAISTSDIVSGFLGNATPTNASSTWGSNSLGIKFSLPGVYFISMIVSNKCGNDTITRKICIQSPPVPSFTAKPQNGCGPVIVKCTNTSTNLNQCGSITRSWVITKNTFACVKDSSNDFVFISGTNTTSQDPEIRFNNQGTYNIVLTLSNSCGTFLSTATTIVVKTKPQIAPITFADICAGGSITANSTSLDCGDGITSSNWVFTDGSPSTSTISNPGSIVFNTSGIKKISLTIANTCGTTTVNTTVNVLPLPTVNAGIDKQFCSGSSVAIGTSAVSGITYQWTPVTGLSSATIATPTLSLSNTGTMPIVSYYILTATNSANCTAKDTLKITVNPLPVIAVNSPAICIGSSVAVTASGADTYSWTPVTNLSGATGSTVIANPTNTSSYIVTGALATTGCFSSAVSTVTIYNLPKVDAGNDVILCNQPISYTLTGYSPAGGTWSGTGVTSNGIFTPSIIGNTVLTYSYTNPVTGCSSSKSITVSVVEPQTAIAGNDFKTCNNNGIITLSGYSPANGTWSGPGISGSTFNPLSAGEGAHNLIYTFGGGTCLSRDTLVATVIAAPIIKVNNAVICVGDSALLTASGADTYKWSPIAGLRSTTGTPVMAGPSATTSYIVTGTTTTTGCSNTATAVLTVNPLPLVNAGTGLVLCNQPIAVKLAGYSPAGGIWSGNGVTGSGMFTPSTVGTTILTYKYADLVTNCNNADTILMSIINPQTADAGTGFNICLNATAVNLSGFSPAGGQWSGDGISGNSFSASTAGTGLHILTYTYGTGTCLSSDTIQVNVNGIPPVTVNSAIICAGDSTKLTAFGADNYVWTPATGLSSTTGASIIAAPSGSITYTVSGTNNATGCSNSVQSTITIKPLPVVKAGADQSLCNQPIPITLSGSPVGGVWFGSPNVTAAGQFTPNGTGTFILYYTYTSSNACVSKDSLKIKVTDPQIVFAGNDTVICLNSNNLQLKGTPAGGNWEGSTLVSTAGLFMPTIAGNYTLYYSYGTATCLKKDTILVVVNALPAVTITPSAAICIGTSIPLTASGADEYTWSPASQLNTTTGANVIASPLATTIFNVTGKNKLTGCVKTVFDTITVNSLPVVDAGPDIVLCNQPVKVTLTGSPAGGVWSGLSNLTSAGIFTPNGVGTFKAYYTFNNGNNCIGKDSLNIKVNNPVNASAGNDTAVCLNSVAVQLNASPAQGIWSGSPLVNSTGLFTPSQPGIFKIIYSTGSSTCLSSDTMVMTVNALPIVSITPSSAICINSSMVLNATGAKTYSWSPATGLNTTTGATVTASPVTTTGYTVSGTDNNGCTNTASNTLKVNPDAIAIFTPAVTVQCPPFMIDAAIVRLQLFPANNSEYKWFAHDSLMGVGQVFPGYKIKGENDSVVIKLITTSLFGCKSDSVSHQFTTPFLPHPMFTLSDSVGCGPLAITFNNKTPNAQLFSFQWNFGNGQTSKAANPGVIKFKSNPTFNDTVYTVFLNVVSGCDTVQVTKSIRVKSKPKAIFTPSRTIGCSPMTVTFSNTSKGLNNAYLWDFGDGKTLSTNNKDAVSHVYHSAKTDTFFVKLIAVNACGADTMTYSLIISPNNINLNFAVNGTSHNGCLPHTVAFYNNTPGGSTFNWNFGDGNTLSTTATVDTVYHTYYSSGTFTVTLNAANSCTDTSATDLITVFPKPHAAFSANKYSLCKGDTVRFTNQSDSATSYLWQFGDGATSVLLNPVHVYKTSGDYIVMLNTYRLNKPGNICVDSAKQPISILANFPGSFTVSDSISNCAPLSVTFVNNNRPSVTAAWDFGDGSFASGDSVVHTFTKSGLFNVSLSATVAGGCTYINKKVIEVNGPSGTFTYKAGFQCINQDARFEAITTGSTSQVWDFGDGTTLSSSESVVYHHYTNPGEYQPSVILKNTTGCNNSIMGIGTIKIDKVDGGFNSTQQKICGSTNVLFKDTSHVFFGTAAVQWNFGDGTNSTGNSIIHNYLTAGTYPIQMIVTGNSGCADTATLQLPVAVNSIPLISILADTIQCTGVPVTLKSTIQSIDDVTFKSWLISNGAAASGNNMTYTFTTTGSYTVRFIAGTVNGCYDTAYHTILIKQSPVIRANGDIVLCRGNSAQLFVSGTTQYQWSPLDGLNCSICNNPIAAPLISTPYVVTGTNDAGCTASDTVIVTVIQPLKMSLSSNDSICIGQSANLLASGAVSYKWSPSQGLSSTSTPTPVASPQITTRYRVVGYDGHNCYTDTAFVVIAVGQYPTVTLGSDAVLAAGTIYPLSTIVTNGPIDTWLWTPSTDLSCNNCPLPYANIKKDINYLVKVTTAYGCTATDTMNIKVFCEHAQVYIPNAFSPDGDGINDILMVRGKGIQAVKSFTVFNRWGQIVFEINNFSPNDPRFGWDGKIKGVVGEPGVYVYIAEAICENGTIFTYKGNTTIIK